MKQPDLISSFEYNGRVDVEWYDVDRKEDLPNLAWQQVYVVGDLGGQVPVVWYEDGWVNLPGGRTEPNETIEQTLHREMEEELNCRVLDWQPLGYQKNIRADTEEVVYQLRVWAKLESIGEFVSDPGGSVLGYKTVPLSELNQHINYGIVGERLVNLTKNHFL